MIKKITTLKNIPEIYCAISIILDKNVDLSEVKMRLVQIGVCEIKECYPKYDSIVSLDIAIIENENFWHLDDALTKMFLKVNNVLDELKGLVKDFNGKFLIDVAFYHYETYPSLEFLGENMEKIRFLEADISIDAY